MKHGVRRNGKRLSTALIEQMSEEYKGQQSGLNSNEKDENANNILENKEHSGTDESEGKSADENNPPNTMDTADVSN